MILTKDQLYTYMYCPLRFYFENNIGITEHDKTPDEVYKEAVMLVVKNFYYTLMDGKFMTPHEIKARWGSVVTSGAKILTEVLNPGMFHTDYHKKGLGVLLQFHQWAKDNCGVPFDIDREFILNIGDHKLSGKIDIVRQKFDKTIDIFSAKTWDSAPDDFMSGTDIDITISAMAFNAIYNTRPDSNTIYVLKSGREIITNRTEDDFKRIATIVNNIAKSIEQEIYFPRWNIHCKKCQYQEQCKAWKR